ncbi:uncharacterized protein [Haliotis asinina]|uniref:uncharacterized protein n=1 Tax=Haliotis asinina TaxID=109174 RepID=UPI0035321DA5
MSSSKECPVWQFEMSVQRIETEKNIRFSEARKLATSATPSGSTALRGKPTYAEVMRPSTKSIDCQTDLTWLTAQTPMSIQDLPSVSSSRKTLQSSETQTAPTPIIKKKNVNVDYSKKQNTSDRLPKGQRGSVSLVNRFDLLDDMEVSPPTPIIKKKNVNVDYSKKQNTSDRLPKGQRGSVSLVNRFDLLDDMEVSPPLTTRSRSHSPKKKGQTPTCSITRKQNTNSLVQYQDLSLMVDVRDYHCSTAHNISLLTGNVTTLLTEADSVPSVTDNTSSVTLNVTDSHLGKVGLLFRCDSSQWSIECAGVTKFGYQKKPECNITSDNDTEVLTLHEEVTLTVDVTAYYDIRGSYCSVDSNFTLQTGDVSQLLHAGDRGLSPITFNVTETHLGGVRLLFNCQVQHWNLCCGGVTRLNNKRKPVDQVATSSVLIISASVVGSLVLIVVVAIVIVFVVKRKVNRIKPRSSVQSCSPPYITVGQPTCAAYAVVEVNNSIQPPSGPGRSHKVDVIDAGGYASVADVVTNGEHTSPWPPKDESVELSALSADRPKKEIGVIVQKIVPEDDQTFVNELYASVNKLEYTTTMSDTTSV